MPTYHCICKFPILTHVLLLLQLHCHFVSGFSLLRIAQSTESLAQQAIPVNCLKRLNMGVKYHKTVQYTKRNLTICLTTEVATWLSVLLLCSGDGHPIRVLCRRHQRVVFILPVLLCRTLYSSGAIGRAPDS